MSPSNANCVRKDIAPFNYICPLISLMCQAAIAASVLSK